MSTLMLTTVCLTALAIASPLQAQGQNDQRSTLSFGDLDGDGFQDALELASGRVRVLWNLGNGDFLDATLESGLSEHRSARKIEWSDCDGDGREEVLLVTSEGVHLYRALANRSFVAFGAGSTIQLEGALDAEWIDDDGDGIEELVVRTANDRRVLRYQAGFFVPMQAASSSAVPSSTGTMQMGPLGPSASSLMDWSGTGGCIEASEIPTLGMLHPVSAYWYVDSSTNNIGIFNIDPQTALDVDGSIRSDSYFRYPNGTFQYSASQQGPQGPNGALGPQGPIGDTGPDGLPGTIGSSGPDGPQGPQGSQGQQGSQGPQGPVGAQGPDGQAGGGFLGTKVLLVQGMDFHASDTGRAVNESWAWGRFRQNSSSTQSLYAAVSLPEGASISKVTFYYYDDSSHNLVADLIRSPFDGSSDVVVKRMQTSGAPLFSTSFGSASHTVNNTDAHYFVKVTPQSQNSSTWDDVNLGIKSVLIEYAHN